MNEDTPLLRVGVDIGGTFTDFVVHDGGGKTLRTFKILSTPDAPERAVLEGLKRLGEASLSEVVHGSTVATNAILERRGARTAFVATQGFRDLLHIGRQSRGAIYDLGARRPAPLVSIEDCFEVRERVDASGRVLLPLEGAAAETLARELAARGVRSVAICLLFSFLVPAHERRLAEALRHAGFSVSASSELLPEFREFERASTTAANAYVAPLVDRYLSGLEAALGTVPLRVMQSNGGRIHPRLARRQPVRTVLSGPAAGVIGAVHAARAAGFTRVITFDMGGTSTDVSLSEGAPQLTAEAEIGGLPLRVPMIDVHSIGSGGGSIAWMDAGGALRVGPQSAGAEPGPACYGQDGQAATVTDANAVLGRIPATVAFAGEHPLDLEAARRALQRLAAAAGFVGGGVLDPGQEAALEVIRLANAQMARALRLVSVERGHDPAGFTLVCFGGAGGLHAGALARELGTRTVLIPAGAATLSAFGMLAADIVKDFVQTVMLPGSATFVELKERVAPLEEQASREMDEEGVQAERVRLEPQVDLRYCGQSYELTVPLQPDFAAGFHAAHLQRFGYARDGTDVEVVSLRVHAVGLNPLPPLPGAGSPGAGDAENIAGASAVVGHEVRPVRLHRGEILRPGDRLEGPGIVAYSGTTVWLSAGDAAAVDEGLNLILEVPPGV